MEGYSPGGSIVGSKEVDRWVGEAARTIMSLMTAITPMLDDETASMALLKLFEDLSILPQAAAPGGHLIELRPSV
jgi:hypothetical protein